MAVRTFPNKYSAKCATCGQQVDIAAGLTRKGDETQGEPKWVTTHSTCPQQAPEAIAQPESTQTKFAPTAEQMNVIHIFATHENLVVQAGAGTGKTSTLKLLANHALVNGRRGQYCAYNAKIVADVKRDMPGNVSCNTMHSLAYAVLGAQFKDRLPNKLNRQPLQEVANLLSLRPLNVPQGSGQRTLAAGWLASKVLAMVNGFCHSADTEIAAKHLPYLEGLDEPNEFGERTYVANKAVANYCLPFARKAWADMINPKGRLRITHDTYLKMWSMDRPVIDVDFIMLDEAQDADPVQVEVIKFNAERGRADCVRGR